MSSSSSSEASRSAPTATHAGPGPWTSFLVPSAKTSPGLLAGGSWVLRTKFGRLDILQYVEPDLDYEKLEPGALEDEVFGLRVRFCGYEDLIAMKEAAGREQDILDLKRLRAVREER